MDRLGLLTHLKSIGLPLSQRQALANGLARAKREGRVVVQQPAPTSSVHPTPLQEETLDRGATPTAPLQETKVAPPAGINSVTIAPGKHCRVFVISDAHADHPANLDWIRTKLPERVDGAFDVCLCAGDVSDKLDMLEEVFRILKFRFDEVVFAAGNHDVVRHRGPHRARACRTAPHPPALPCPTAMLSAGSVTTRVLSSAVGQAGADPVGCRHGRQRPSSGPAHLIRPAG